MRHRPTPLVSRTLVVVVALTAAIGAVGAGGPPAGAAVGWRPPAEDVPDAPTYVLLHSDPDDSIGRGQHLTYTQADSDITVTLDGPRITVAVRGEESWNARFAPPASVTTLQTGLYEGLTRAPFHDPAVGGLSFSGEGRACNDLTGWYEVDEVVTSGSQVDGFTLRFGQHCQGRDAALHGQIRWDRAAEDPPAPTPVPAGDFWTPDVSALPVTGSYLFLSSSPGDYIGVGRTYLYDAAEVAATAPSGRISAVTITGPTQPEWWHLSFATSNRATTVEPGLYDDIARWPFHNPVRGGFDLSGEGRGCSDLLADVVVDEIDLRGDVLGDVRMRFAQRCGGSGPPLFGELRWQPPAPAGTPEEIGRVGVTPTADGDRVSWTVPASASPITGFDVVVYVGGTAVETIPLAGGTHTVLLPHTHGEGTYSYKVAARNQSGTGPRSRAARTVAPPRLGPFADLPALVRQQHLDLVGRLPSLVEETRLLAELQAGWATPAHIASLATSAPWATDRAPVTRLYAAYFVRLPDLAGLEHWAAQVRSGRTLGEVSSLFARSAEFRRTYGSLSDAAFVALVYRNVLGRAPDAAGAAYWEGRLATGMARSRLMLLFSESAEHRTLLAPTTTAVLLTSGMVRRVATASEVATWSADGATAEEIAWQLLESDEYRRRILG